MAGTPMYSVIIPVRPGALEFHALAGLSVADVEPGRVEVLVAQGTSPAAQRNAAIRKAQGDVLVFLDDDSEIAPNLFRVLDERFADPSVHGVGGPNLASAGASSQGRAEDMALCSAVGAPKVRARYRAVGGVREALEDDLILCNFALRRSVFEKERPFDERLYPNEENELFHRLKSHGVRLLYDPSAVVFRNRDEGLFSFARRVARYGRGRMEQTLFHPSNLSLTHLAPLGLLGLLGLTLLASAWWMWGLWGLYAAVLVGEGARLASAAGRMGLWPKVTVSLAILHFGYAVGLLLGLLGFPFRFFLRKNTSVSVALQKGLSDPFPGQRGGA